MLRITGGKVYDPANGIHGDMARLATAATAAEQEKAYRSLQTRGATLELLRPGAPAAAKTNAIALLNEKAVAEIDLELVVTSVVSQSRQTICRARVNLRLRRPALPRRLHRPLLGRLPVPLRHRPGRRRPGG